MLKKILKIIIIILRFFFFLILFFLIYFLVLIIINYKNFDLDEMFFDRCHLKKIFKENTYKENFCFSDGLRDTFRFSSFSLSETENNLKKFSKIDEKYFESDEVKFIFKRIDYAIKNEEKSFTKEEIEILKNIKNEIKIWEKQKDTVYNFFYLKEGLADNELCLYKKSENKGYCIVNHM